MGNKPPKPPGLFSSDDGKRFHKDSVIEREKHKIEERYGPMDREGKPWTPKEDLLLITLILCHRPLHKFFVGLKRHERGIVTRWWKLAARSPGAVFTRGPAFSFPRARLPWTEADTILLHRATSEVAFRNGATLDYAAELLGRHSGEIPERIWLDMYRRNDYPEKALTSQRVYEKLARTWHAATKPPRKSSLIPRK